MPWIPLLQHLSCINWLYLRLPSVLSPFLLFLPFALSGPKFLIAHSPFFPLTTCSLNYTNHQRNCAKSPITVIPTRRRKWVTVISYIELNLCLKKLLFYFLKSKPWMPHKQERGGVRTNRWTDSVKNGGPSVQNVWAASCLWQQKHRWSPYVYFLNNFLIVSPVFYYNHYCLSSRLHYPVGVDLYCDDPPPSPFIYLFPSGDCW